MYSTCFSFSSAFVSFNSFSAFSRLFVRSSTFSRIPESFLFASLISFLVFSISRRVFSMPSLNARISPDTLSFLSRKLFRSVSIPFARSFSCAISFSREKYSFLLSAMRASISPIRASQSSDAAIDPDRLEAMLSDSRVFSAISVSPAFISSARSASRCFIASISRFILSVFISLFFILFFIIFMSVPYDDIPDSFCMSLALTSVFSSSRSLLSS